MYWSYESKDDDRGQVEYSNGKTKKSVGQGSFLETLHGLGKEGWELVGVQVFGEKAEKLYFKRPF